MPDRPEFVPGCSAPRSDGCGTIPLAPGAASPLHQPLRSLPGKPPGPGCPGCPGFPAAPGLPPSIRIAQRSIPPAILDGAATSMLEAFPPSAPRPPRPPRPALPPGAPGVGPATQVGSGTQSKSGFAQRPPLRTLMSACSPLSPAPPFPPTPPALPAPPVKPEASIVTCSRAISSSPNTPSGSRSSLPT